MVKGAFDTFTGGTSAVVAVVVDVVTWTDITKIRGESEARVVGATWKA